MTFSLRLKEEIYKNRPSKLRHKKAQNYGFFLFEKNSIHIKIDKRNIQDAIGPFLSGVYLACGYMTDPQSKYYMEFTVNNESLANNLLGLLKELGHTPKIVIKHKHFIVYLRESEQIEDIVTMMGATNSTFEIMNIKIYKGIRNKVNRETNCVTANIDKTINASTSQLSDIDYIIKTQGIDILPDELKSLAVLRIENSDFSLRELGEAMNPPLSRSGVNHRLKRISRIASEIRESMQFGNQSDL